MARHMLIRRQVLRLLCLSVAAGSAWALDREAAAPPVRIGVSLSLSGAYMHDGIMQQKAYRLWAQHINQRGGLLGRPVEMIIRDDRSDAEAARRIYQEFIERDRLDLVFGPFSSGITLAVAPIVERNAYPMLAAGAASDEIWRQGYRYIFGTIPAAGRQTLGMLALLAEAGIESLALVHTIDAYAVDLAAGARQWAAEFGIRITSTQQVARGTSDLTSQARLARQSGAQALLMAGHFDESVNMRRALKLIDWTPAAFFASVGPTLDQYGQVLRGDAEGVFATSTWEAREELKYPGSADFLHEFVRTYNEPPSFIGAQAYAAGQILERAVAKAGGIERRALRAALSALDTEVIIGRYAVDQSGLLIKRFPLLIQWQKGRREIVWPAEMRTAPARFVR